MAKEKKKEKVLLKIDHCGRRIYGEPGSEEPPPVDPDPEAFSAEPPKKKKKSWRD